MIPTATIQVAVRVASSQNPPDCLLRTRCAIRTMNRIITTAVDTIHQSAMKFARAELWKCGSGEPCLTNSARNAARLIAKIIRRIFGINSSPSRNLTSNHGAHYMGRVPAARGDCTTIIYQIDFIFQRWLERPPILETTSDS
jgi:hypothetical protein